MIFKCLHLILKSAKKGESIDSANYVHFILKTEELWRKLPSDPTRLSDLLWMHDNAGPHSAAHTQEFVNRRKMMLVPQSPYSPALNLFDRWLFKELKSKLRQCSSKVPLMF